MTIYKFSGAGNDFVVLDGRQGGVEAFRQADNITALCREYRTDGLMILGLAGTNFLVEMAINLVLATAVVQIVGIARKSSAVTA